MQYQHRTFRTFAGSRDASVCEANGTHAGRDLRGRCSFCGTPIPAPAAELEAYGLEFDRLTSTPDPDPSNGRPAE